MEAQYAANQELEKTKASQLFPPPTPIQPIKEEPSTVGRFAGQVGVGVVQTLGTLPGALEAVTHSDFLHNVNNNIEEWTKEHTPEDFAFSDQLARGFGSALSFYIPSYGIMRGASTMYKVLPKIALALGISTDVGLEAASEAGAVYREALAKHGDE